MKKQILLLLLPALLLSAAGCKKDDGEKAATCRINSIAGFNGSKLSFTRDDDGRISSMTASNLTYTYTYSGNSVVVANVPADIRDSFTSNSAGQVTNIRYYQGTDWENTQYNRNAAGEITQSIYTNSTPGSTPQSRPYTYTNGNLTSIGSGAGSITYSYDLSKPAQTGDYLSYINHTGFKGFNLLSSKNLVNAEDSKLISYEYDADGKVAKMTTVKGSNTSTFTYTYLCK